MQRRRRMKMMAQVQGRPTFLVTRKPEWYLAEAGEADNPEAYTCLCKDGLLKAIARTVTASQREVFYAEEQRCQPRVLQKKIRDRVIGVASKLKQKPSRTLTMALMDLVDVLGGNEFGSVATVDRTGLKHVLLTYGNYTAYYIPNGELNSPGNRRILIPVVTQYTESHNLVRYDATRSMVGTYSVVLQKTGADADSRRSYFLQEVLYAPGLSSLQLLVDIAGHLFEFWDMALEMPTHPKALTPAFQQIQPCQLLLSEESGAHASGEEQVQRELLASHMEDVQPLCCVANPRDLARNSKKREASMDCFETGQVRCNLERFETSGSGGARMVYFRRSSKMGGRRGNLLPVVALRKEQELTEQLSVSTSLRFYRALKHTCVKGSGELMSCWDETLQELSRDTFLAGPEMWQDIQQAALSAFTRRVNPSGWRNTLPRHVESKISNPTMIQVVELAMVFMEAKIPSAFAAAELLHCPLKRVRRYVAFRNRYASSQELRTSVRKHHAYLMRKRMLEERRALSDLLACYAERKRGSSEEVTSKASKCVAMLGKERPLADITKIQKVWYQLSKADNAKDKGVYANAKVSFLKLRTYQSKLKKAQHHPEWSGERGGKEEEAVEEEEEEEEEEEKEEEEQEKEQEEQEQGHGPVERKSAHKSPGAAAERGASLARAEPKGKGTTRRPKRKPHESPYIVPDAVPISQWIKNMSVLLLSDPWLHGEPERRDAVLILLHLDKTLLHPSHVDTLDEWVASNLGVVSILSKRKLKDRLTQTLIKRAYEQSTCMWAEKIHATLAQVMRRDPPRRLRSPTLQNLPRSGADPVYQHRRIRTRPPARPKYVREICSRNTTSPFTAPKVPHYDWRVGGIGRDNRSYRDFSLREAQEATESSDPSDYENCLPWEKPDLRWQKHAGVLVSRPHARRSSRPAFGTREDGASLCAAQLLKDSEEDRYDSDDSFIDDGPVHEDYSDKYDSNDSFIDDGPVHDDYSDTGESDSSSSKNEEKEADDDDDDDEAVNKEQKNKGRKLSGGKLK